MYRTGAAGLGAESYMKSVNGKEDNGRPKSGILFDETVLLQNALRHNNLSESSLTPQAYNALLEQARRYALEILVDAQDYAQHASRGTVASLTPSDLTLAAEMRGDINGIPSTLPRFEDMAEYASELNMKPLPPIPMDCYNGVTLPPVEEQLTFRTFDIVNGARNVQKMMNGGDLPLSSVDVALVKRSVNVDSILTTNNGANTQRRVSKTQTDKSSYGAGKGRQIAIHLKGSGGDSSSKGAGEGAKPGVSKIEAKNKRKLTEL
jgi:histone H3/H4